MGNEWKDKILGEVVKLRRGHDLPTSKRREGNVPIMGSFGITGQHDEAKVKGPGVTIGRSGGSMGVVNFIEEDYWPLNTALYVTDFCGNDPYYVYLLLSQIDFERYNSGSAQPSLNRNYIYDIPLTIPGSIRGQKEIASVIQTLDDKIALNRQQNATLEAMAQALFRSWFVDFDPVLDKALAAGHDIPEPLQPKAQRRLALGDKRKPLPPEVTGLFPDRFVYEEEVGWVPEGWGKVSLGDITKVVSKGTTPRKSDVIGYEGTVPFIKVKDINDDGEIDVENLLKIPEQIHATKLKRSILIPDDLLFSIAGTIGRVARIPNFLDGCNCNQAVAFIRLKNVGLHLNYVQYWLKSKDTQNEVLSQIVQGVQANVSLTNLKELNLVLPQKELLENWEKHLKVWVGKIQTNQDETRNLKGIRDTLLPKLISGELQVNG